MRTNTPAFSASQWLISAFARLESSECRRNHRADRIAPAKAPEQREAEQFTVAIERDAARDVEQGRQQSLRSSPLARDASSIRRGASFEPSGRRRSPGGNETSGGWNAAP